MAQRILLTDDDELVLVSLEELLGTEGFEVATASNGKDALERAAKEWFDLVVLDVVMPGMSGLEVCKAMRRMESYRDVPIVMLTAKSAEADRKRGLEAGASLFLPKPIHPASLVAMIREALAGRGAGG